MLSTLKTLLMRGSFIGVAFLIVLCLSCLKTEEVYEGPPSIKFEDTLYNFGEISQGEQVTCTFKFKNVGGDTLRIAKVRKSCGCTSAKATKQILKPGGSGEIEVVFNSRGYSGNVTKTVHVHSNDPKKSVVTLRISGRVIVDLLVQPRQINFGEVYPGKSITKSVRLIPKRLDELKVKKIEKESEYITITTKEFVEDNKKGVQINATLSSEAPPRSITEKLKVYTNSKRQPVVEIPVYAWVTNKAWVNPKVINFRAQRGSSHSEEIVVGVGKKKNLKIVGIEDDLEGVSTKYALIKDEGDHQTYSVTFEISKEAKVGSLRGSIRLHTNEKSQPLLQILVNGVIE